MRPWYTIQLRIAQISSSRSKHFPGAVADSEQYGHIPAGRRLNTFSTNKATEQLAF
jgi:hypothetical protein